MCVLVLIFVFTSELNVSTDTCHALVRVQTALKTLLYSKEPPQASCLVYPTTIASKWLSWKSLTLTATLPSPDYLASVELQLSPASRCTLILYSRTCA
ncbi:hypothetical protein BGW80DRAFT_1347369 [Lactifluus volemus]|nr:hypothetical protein BGW80DRAFT_1347369 [Lactifluus volemus]